MCECCSLTEAISQYKGHCTVCKVHMYVLIRIVSKVHMYNSLSSTVQMYVHTLYLLAQYKYIYSSHEGLQMRNIVQDLSTLMYMCMSMFVSTWCWLCIDDCSVITRRSSESRITETDIFICTHLRTCKQACLHTKERKIITHVDISIMRIEWKP